MPNSLSKQANRILKKDQLARLVQPENFLGYVYYLDYDVARIMTNDVWKANALGVPMNSFLIAVPFDPDHFDSVREEDRMALLLRTMGATKLPQDDDLVRAKIDHFQQQKSIYGDNDARDFDDLSLQQMQFGGLECSVLGTFFSRNDELWLGSDLESFPTAGRYRVFRLRTDALETVVNYVDPLRKQKAKEDAEQLGIKNAIHPLKIGTVRYTSTDRMHRNGPQELVPVSIQPMDILSRRTAVLGMTRTGKSNLIKTLVSVCKRVADEAKVNVGQCIYDINGEYANANQQDQGAIADIYPSDTIRYRMLSTPGFEDLRNNFYDQLTAGYNTILQELVASGLTGQGRPRYLDVFVNLTFDEPDPQDRGEHVRWERRVAAYKTLLHKAGFAAPAGQNTVRFSANAAVRRAVDQQAGKTFNDPSRGLTLSEAAEWFAAARALHMSGSLPTSSSGGSWMDDAVIALANLIAQRDSTDRFISGYRVFAGAVKYHSPRRIGEVSDEIYNHLANGKIVIIDLSVGSSEMRATISKSIASKIFHRSMENFIDGGYPPNILIYVEEAHNLIGGDMDLTDTWPRLAKEGAKYRIGLVYATQEVSSVHKNILANTENWFVSHLNNEQEIKTLAKFYDFADFSRSLIRAQDVGFERVKTLSSPFVIPVQIDKFDPSAEKARVGAQPKANSTNPSGRGGRTNVTIKASEDAEDKA